MTYEDDLEEHLLVDLHKLLIPLFDIGGLLARVGVIVLGCGRILAVLIAPLENLLHYGLVYLGREVSMQLGVKVCGGGEGRTLGMGIASSFSLPRSSSKFLIRMLRSATSRSTSMFAPSEVVILTFLADSVVFAVVDMLAFVVVEYEIRLVVSTG